LGQSVTDGDPPAEALQLPGQLGVERRAAGNQDAQPRPELSVQRPQQQLTEAQPQPPAQPSAKGGAGPEQQSGDPAGGFGPRPDTRGERAVQPGDAEDQGHLSLLQGADELRP